MEKENLIKKVCKEYGLTYKELGERIGYSESAIRSAANSKISEPMEFAINLYIETLQLKEKLKNSEEIIKENDKRYFNYIVFKRLIYNF